MPKIILFLALGFSLLAASELSEFQRAQTLEQSGDIKGAMQIYKSIAENSINAQSLASKTSLNAEPATPEAKVKQAKITQENKAEHHLQNALGIELYKFNYLLPVTYAKTVPDDGRKSVETKFQISLAKPLFYDVFGLRESLVAAYTQTSWWQITKKSSPFRETNYQPENFLKFCLTKISRENRHPKFKIWPFT